MKNNNNQSRKDADIRDPKRDHQKLKEEITTIDLPEIKDIPGQEYIRVPQFREMQDVTISSAGEEGERLLDDLNKENDETDIDTISNVTEEEKKLLNQSTGHSLNSENTDLEKIALDNTDNEGVPLNEKGFEKDKMGLDLDVPGSELDDDNESIAEEDEENNLYSRRD